MVNLKGGLKYMMEYEGKYTKGKILIDNFEGNIVNQLYSVLNHPAFEGCNVSVMPDCHIGKGVMVGFTSTMKDMIVPSVIGVDIGCGVSAYNLGRLKKVKADKLDKFIRKNIPTGSGTRDKYIVEPSFIKPLIDKMNMDYKKVMGSLGTLGGSNHFIEIDKDDNNNFWLVIHSGSRSFGFIVAKYHQRKAKEVMKNIYGGSAYHGLEYLPMNQGGEEYIKDMQLAQKYASLNRETMARLIIEKFYKLHFETLEKIETIHNYIDLKDNIIRKGAISAHKGERLIIPFNMQFGCVIGTGKSSKENNYSAPHGCGRILARSNVSKSKKALEQYKKAMKGIYTTSVSKNTIAESPMAYKKPKLILENISDLIDIDFFVKPVYNLKPE